MSDGFRRGFLYGMAAAGITPSEFGEMLVKQASLIPGAETAGSMAGHLGDVAIAAAMLTPPLLGGAAGVLGYGLTRPDYQTDIKKNQNTETINTLRQKAREIQNRLKGGITNVGEPERSPSEHAAPGVGAARATI